MNFEKYILWSQGDTRAAESLFIKDSKSISERDSDEVFSYISIVNGSCEWHQAEDSIKDVEFADEISPSFKLYMNKLGDILITSHFTDVDDANRRIVYAFCSKGHDFLQAAERLKEASDVIGRSCNPADLKLLERLHIKKKKKREILIIIFILIILITILTLILLYHFGYINLNSIESLWERIRNSNN